MDADIVEERRKEQATPWPLIQTQPHPTGPGGNSVSLKTQQSVERTLTVESDKFDLASGSNQVICNQLLHVPNLGENPQVMGVQANGGAYESSTVS